MISYIFTYDKKSEQMENKSTNIETHQRKSADFGDVWGTSGGHFRTIFEDFRKFENSKIKNRLNSVKNESKKH